MKRKYINVKLCKVCQYKYIDVEWCSINCWAYKLEDKKMNNYFMLDGKKIPMSDETAKSLREEQSVKVPMVRSAKISGENRIIIRITKNMRDRIMYYLSDNVFAFDKEGILCNHWSENNMNRINQYYSIETLFEGELE